MWPDCIYYITVMMYCCVLAVYNTIYKFVNTQRDGFCKKKKVRYFWKPIDVSKFDLWFDIEYLGFPRGQWFSLYKDLHRYWWPERKCALGEQWSSDSIILYLIQVLWCAIWKHNWFTPSTILSIHMADNSVLSYFCEHCVRLSYY